MGQLSKLNTQAYATFEVCGITYGYVDINNVRNIYEMSTKTKMLSVNIERVGNKIESFMSYFTKQSRVDRVNKYIADGVEDKNWIGDRDYLL